VHASCDELKNDANLLLHDIGLPDSATVDCIIGFTVRLEIAQLSRSVESVSDEDQLLITLIKLRHNFTEAEAGRSLCQAPRRSCFQPCAVGTR